MSPAVTHSLSSRQKGIFELAKENGAVNVDDLAEKFAVTTQTIRRDLAQLSQYRLVQRIHGGAVIWDSVENLGYEARKMIAMEGKEDIGRRCAERIPNDCSVFINIGTTTEQCARFLTRHSGLLVVTNNLNVLNTLMPCDQIDLMTAGGRVRREDGGVVGESAVDFIKQFKVDYAIIGSSAIEQDGTVLDFDPSEVRVAQSMIEHARSVMLLADSTKFRRSAPFRICDLLSIDTFVTDIKPDEPFMESASRCDTRVDFGEAGLS
ncbi:MAG: DeoR/GlpR family DNA-binding transcription regulator [Pseudomonadota bacterium]